MIASLLKSTRRVGVLLAFSLALATAAKAQLTLNAVDRGWYDSTGYHIPSNNNFLTGDYGDSVYRSFFVFDLSALSGTNITSAKLRLYNPEGSSGSENLTIYGFGGNINTLVAGGTGLTSIYADLGNSPTFSSSISVNPSTTGYLEFTLNSNFFNAAEDLIGLGKIAVGLTLTSISPDAPDEYIFAYSDNNAPDDWAQLILNGNITAGPSPAQTAVPEPSTYGLIAAAALLGLVARRRFVAKKA